VESETDAPEIDPRPPASTTDLTEDLQPVELAAGLWSWSRRHPEWHPGDFGAEVVSFLAQVGDETVLVDPLLSGDDDPAWQLVESVAKGPIRVLITITYHVRSAEDVRERFAGAAGRPVSIHGHKAIAKRLGSANGFEPFAAGDRLPAGVSAYPIGKPRRFETPLLLPSHSALIFGDALVGTDGGPRIWAQERIDERVLRFNRERFGPSLEPLLELDFDRLLFTHGPSLLEGGKAGLREAIDSPPWYHRPV
jgi:glyoxylase-like metal-dependent hydrolase (beta-lactamase superfamily II)